MKNYIYFNYIAIAFVVMLMISNTVSSKLISLGGFVFAGAVLLFPLTYIFGDILTEVYGYKESRKIIWTGFFSLIIMSLCYLFVGKLPAASFWTGQEAYDQILGTVPRIVAASIIAFLVGEFCNSYILAKLKVATKGKFLFVRTIGSTLVGELIDSIIFVCIAFWGLLPLSAIIITIYSGYVLKVLIEVAMTPITYKVVSYLKKAEGVDVYDDKTNFNPLAIK